jgi:NADP-dependent 3-hydroxy acid dehydrogenase YdfG
LWPEAQVLRAGDAVVAAARRPEQSPGLTKLKQRHGAALQLVKLDVNDDASLKVALVPRCWFPRAERRCSRFSCNLTR